MFLGDGYDDRFVENMQRIAAMCTSPANLLRVVDDVDDVCSRCPYCDGTACLKDNDGAAVLDAAAQSVLGIEPGQIYISHILRKRVEEAILSGRLKSVCEACPWYVSHCRQAIDDFISQGAEL